MPPRVSRHLPEVLEIVADPSNREREAGAQRLDLETQEDERADRARWHQDVHLAPQVIEAQPERGFA
jgi:hypothetical protein